MKRALGRGGLLVLGILASLLLAEGFFRTWGATIGSRVAPEASADAQRVILCIGDSHTWGRGVGYPGRLAARLAERGDDTRVINLGVPGTNTAQIRQRLDEQIDRYRPDAIVVWSGVNNAWNRAGRDEVPVSWTERLWRESRLLRFVRVLRHQRELESIFAQHGAYVAPRPKPTRGEIAREEGGTRFDRVLGDATDRYVNTSGADRSDEEVRRVTAADLRLIVLRARERGVPVVLIAYGLFGGPYGAAADGIRDAAYETGAPLVDALRAGESAIHRAESEGVAPPELYDASVHPTQPLYDAVGDHVLEILASLDASARARADDPEEEG